MERVSETVRGWITSTGLSSYRLSRRAGVSASTLSRVLSDSVDPTLGTLQEIAIACGLQLHVEARPSSDPLAARAARSMLEDGYPEATPEVEQWTQRLIRLSEDDHPVPILATAARYAAPLRRQGAFLFKGDIPLGQIASAGAASEGQWAVSGAAGLYLPPNHNTPAPSTTILWCTEPRRASQLLTDSPLESESRPNRATVAVVEAEAELFTGSFNQGLVTYAAPIQIMLDCLSMDGQVADDALKEVNSW